MTQEDAIARCRAMSIKIDSLVSIKVIKQCGSLLRCAIEGCNQYYAMKIAKNTLDEHIVRLMRIINMEIDLLHGVCNVWMSECEILQGSNEPL